MSQTPPNPQSSQGSGTGCWLIGALSALLAIVLVVVGLFLPPFNLYDEFFGEPYTELQQAGDALALGDFSLAAATDPSDEFGVQLGAINLQTFITADAQTAEWIPQARSALPDYLALQSPVYSVKTRGNSPDAVLMQIGIPSGAARAELLDLYGWFTDDTGAGEWQFIPSQPANGTLETTTDRIPERLAIFQAAPDAPEVMVSYDVSRALSSEVADVATIIAPGGLQPTLQGSVTGSLAAGFDLNADYTTMPLVADYSDPRAIDTETVVSIISNSQLRQTHIRELTLLASGGGYDGLFIDYRGLPADQRENFTRFVQDLNASLNGVGRMLGVIVPAAQNTDGVWDTGAYDWRAIGQAADFVKINLSDNPTTYVPNENQLIEAMLRWGTGEINRTKILLGLSARSIREIAGTYTPIGYDTALAGLGDVQIEADDISETGTIRPGSEIRAYLDGRDAVSGVDTRINAPYLDYQDEAGNTTARVWLTTPDALRFRMDRTIPFALGGVGFDDLLDSDLADGILTAIENYREQIPSVPAATDLALRWRIEGNDGTVDEVTTSLSEDLTVTLTAPDGNYAVNASVIGVGQEAAAESARTGAEVALFRPSPTPTPLPTATPTPVPTATPTPAPIVATAPPSNGGGGSSGNFNANPLNAGRIAAGNFEYGGHSTSASSGVAINAMRSAGMTWMKVQVRYPADAAGVVQAAQSAGFKILIGTVGNPADLAQGGDSYVQNYVNWLGGIAAAGADAIEVWNEPNISREWPEGQISGSNYASMLRRAYTAIKSTNSGTMVISGAPAPTGAEAAFPGQIVNDDNFLRQFVNAGGLQYADCIGVHYNEGIVPPTNTSGDPRNPYYTRYLPSMVNIYWDIVGGQRPLCFTELGYLTSDGYPPLPAAFSWASNVTVDQQAAWLAQAAAYLSQTGRVRMMIVWNVDFRAYGGDPQAGYAIIRNNGSCPACNALSGVR